MCVRGHVPFTSVYADYVYKEVKESARDAILSLIQKDRDGEEIDTSLVKSVLGIYVEMGLDSMDHYENDFEYKLLEETSSFYSRKAAEWINEDSCPEYMLKAEDCIKREKERVDQYLHHSSETKVLREVDKQLLTHYQKQLIEKEHSGCAALLNDDKTNDLARMFRLFQRISQLQPIADLFKEHVKSKGMELVKQAHEAADSKRESKKDSSKTPEQIFVKSVIELHDKYLSYVYDCFSNNAIFHKALREAFEAFCNTEVAGNSTPELLANFCDNLLKKGGSEKLSDEEIEESLGKVVSLLAYITERDLFAEFHRKKLSRRLLFDRSANDDHERSVLQKLKQQCGAQFTSKMCVERMLVLCCLCQHWRIKSVCVLRDVTPSFFLGGCLCRDGMVQDLALAKDMQSAFEDWLKSQPEAKQPYVDLNVTVLTTGFWPSYKSVELELPYELQQSIEVFKDFYSSRAQHRKLTWIYSLGQCIVQGRFDTKAMELTISTFQTALLILFNEHSTLTFEELQQKLGMPSDDLSRVLYSLACHKYKILIKDPEGKEVNSGDSFTLNTKFSDKMRRIKVPLPAQEDKKKVHEEVDKDREYLMDAAIVRIMKSRKTMQHQQLVMEVVQQLMKSFKPDAKQIKKRLEVLQEREYIERDPDEPTKYKYAAISICLSMILSCTECCHFCIRMLDEALLFFFLPKCPYLTTQVFGMSMQQLRG